MKGDVIMVEVYLTYDRYNVVKRPSIGNAIVLSAKLSGDTIEKSLGRVYADNNLIFILNRYDVEVLSCKIVGTARAGLLFMLERLKGYVGSKRRYDDLVVEFEIPVTVKLMDAINEARARGESIGFRVRYSLTLLNPSFESIELIGYVRRPHPDVPFADVIVLFSEEVDDILKKSEYAEFIRLEIPVPLIPQPLVELLRKSSEELKAVESLIMRGEYGHALDAMRNIIMNYLTVVKEGRRVLRDEIRSFILNIVSEKYRDLYEKVLEGLEETLRANLEHIHKFVKEDASKLVAAPLREEVEYVYYMLINVVRYLSQLILTWTLHK